MSPLARPLSSLASGSGNRMEMTSPLYGGASGGGIRFDKNIHRQLRESEDIDMMKLSAESLPENRLSSFRDVCDLSPQVRRRAQR